MTFIIMENSSVQSVDNISDSLQVLNNNKSYNFGIKGWEYVISLKFFNKQLKLNSTH